MYKLDKPTAARRVGLHKDFAAVPRPATVTALAKATGFNHAPQNAETMGEQKIQPTYNGAKTRMPALVNEIQALERNIASAVKDHLRWVDELIASGRRKEHSEGITENYGCDALIAKLDAACAELSVLEKFIAANEEKVLPATLMSA